MDKTFLRAKDISKILGVSDTMSYKIIQRIRGKSVSTSGYLVRAC